MLVLSIPAVNSGISVSDSSGRFMMMFAIDPNTMAVSVMSHKTKNDVKVNFQQGPNNSVHSIIDCDTGKEKVSMEVFVERSTRSGMPGYRVSIDAPRSCIIDRVNLT